MEDSRSPYSQVGQQRGLWLAWIALVSLAIAGLTFGFFTNPEEFADYARLNFTSFNDGERTKAVHYTFMSVAFGTLMTISVNAHRTLPFTRDVNRHIHTVLHTFAVAGIAVAFTYIYLFIEVSGTDGPHWGNLHSQFGLGIVALVFTLYVFSFIIWYLLPARMGRVRVLIAPYHRFIGFTVYILSITQIFLALWVKQNDEYGPPYNIAHPNLTIPLFLVIFYALAVGTTVYNIYHRKASMGVSSASTDLDPINA